jgi:hypothetical protein
MNLPFSRIDIEPLGKSIQCTPVMLLCCSTLVAPDDVQMRINPLVKMFPAAQIGSACAGSLREGKNDDGFPHDLRSPPVIRFTLRRFAHITLRDYVLHGFLPIGSAGPPEGRQT